MKQPITPGYVRGLMIDRGISQTDITEALGLTDGHISLVLSAKRLSSEVIRYVADQLDLSFDEVYSSFRQIYRQHLIDQAKAIAA